MLFSVLIVSSNPTLFINNGSRNNYGKLSKKNTFEKEGVYIECDVLKFEKKICYMECKYMVFTEEQNTSDNTENLLTKNIKKLQFLIFGLDFMIYQVTNSSVGMK